VTAIGCGLILFTLLAVILSLVAGQAGFPEGVMQIVRIAIFAPLAIFLLLQLLLVVAKPAAKPDSDTG